MSILTVDDSPHILTQLKFFLNSRGYQNINFAVSASEAFKLLGIDNPNQDAEQFDLILMDIKCP